mmetsp:Transcript_76722/g.135993  ORF Transcript_76722/g.135993 Transcript_76722/m.135993 type:complete len:177 (+) Transcript_76722:83-613(+)
MMANNRNDRTGDEVLSNAAFGSEGCSTVPDAGHCSQSNAEEPTCVFCNDSGLHGVTRCLFCYSAPGDSSFKKPSMPADPSNVEVDDRAASSLIERVGDVSLVDEGDANRSKRIRRRELIKKSLKKSADKLKEVKVENLMDTLLGIVIGLVAFLVAVALKAQMVVSGQMRGALKRRG